MIKKKAFDWDANFVKKHGWGWPTTSLTEMCQYIKDLYQKDTLQFEIDRISPEKYLGRVISIEFIAELCNEFVNACKKPKFKITPELEKKFHLSFLHAETLSVMLNDLYQDTEIKCESPKL